MLKNSLSKCLKITVNINSKIHFRTGIIFLLCYLNKYTYLNDDSIMMVLYKISTIFNSILFFKKILLYFFHYHLGPLNPSPPSNHHTVVHVHEFLLLFAKSLHPCLAVILLSESVYILLVSSVCSFESSYK